MDPIDSKSASFPISPRREGPRWALFYGIETDDPWAETGRAIEEEVFIKSLDYTAGLVHDEYEPYDSVSIWIVLANMHEGAAVGAIRAIVGDLEELKIADDLRHRWGVTLAEGLADHGVDASEGVVECATVSVLPEWRRSDSHWPTRALCATFGHLVLDLGADWCLQLQDVSGPRLLRRQLGLPFEVLANLPPVDFLGPVIPTISHVAEHSSLFAEHADPDLVALFSHRDETVRGGTTLPVIDLTTTSSPLVQRVLAG